MQSGFSVDIADVVGLGLQLQVTVSPVESTVLDVSEVPEVLPQ